jgi:hypothetical protein
MPLPAHLKNGAAARSPAGIPEPRSSPAWKFISLPCRRSAPAQITAASTTPRRPWPHATTRSDPGSDASATARAARPSPTSRASCAPPRRRSARPDGPVARHASPARGLGAGAQGSIAALRSRSAGRRRVIVKTRVVRLKGADLSAAWAHLRYVQRDGVTREGQPGELYDAASDEADGKAFLERSGGDRHQFRCIVSPRTVISCGRWRTISGPGSTGAPPTILIPPRSSLSWGN